MRLALVLLRHAVAFGTLILDYARTVGLGPSPLSNLHQRHLSSFGLS